MDNKYSIIIDSVNGEHRTNLENRTFDLEHICKGGFRFITDQGFDLEDRLQVTLTMPDTSTRAVLGRICYSDMIDDNRALYGFSVLKGFYSLDEFDDDSHTSTDPDLGGVAA